MKFLSGKLLLATLILLSGCATQVPKFSHIHLGHSLTGWVNTPHKKGLFVVAEDMAKQAAGLSQESLDASDQGKIDLAKRKLREVDRLIGSDPKAKSEKPDDYSFLSAFQGSVDHMLYAKDSEDVSANLSDGVDQFVQNSQAIFARAEVMRSLLEVAAAESSADQLRLVAGEVKKLCEQLLDGEDIDGNGEIGNTADEYGLRQLRRDMAAVINREDPPYRAVKQRYLFGLIRLPDGTWKFKPPSRNADGGSGGGY